MSAQQKDENLHIQWPDPSQVSSLPDLPKCFLKNYCKEIEELSDTVLCGYIGCLKDKFLSFNQCICICSLRKKIKTIFPK
jgi:hypothetical protein